VDNLDAVDVMTMDKEGATTQIETYGE
jgi:hypothetical protein